jgi:nitrilase
MFTLSSIVHTHRLVIEFSSYWAVIGIRSPKGRDEYLQYHKAAVTLADLEEVSKIRIELSVGFIERDNGALVCSVLGFSYDPLRGELVYRRENSFPRRVSGPCGDESRITSFEIIRELFVTS